VSTTNPSFEPDDSTDTDTDLDAGPALVGVVSLTVPFADAGLRLDTFIANAEPRLSRSRATQLVDEGVVTIDGAPPKKSSHKLRGGEQIVITVPPPAPTTLIGEDLPLSIVYDDDDLCVIDKAAGQVVHPGAGHESGTIANAMVFRYPKLSVGGERRPGIVHRLDKDTSGLLVVAKHDEALRNLAAQFANRTVDKRYIAVCFGVPGPLAEQQEIVTGHRRGDGDRRRFTTKVDPPEDGETSGQLRLAHTLFTVRCAAASVAVVDIKLMTGRTHQIRAHFADRGHPLLQDDLYGGVHIERRLKNGPVRDVVIQLHRQALHAATLTFKHPRTGKKLSFSSPLPPDMAVVVDAVELASQTDSTV